MKTCFRNLVLFAATTSLLANGVAFAAPTCSEMNEAKIVRLKAKTILFHPENGKTTLGAIGMALGATALGTTAGGVAGFILPYAISGATYAVMGVGAGVSALGIFTPLTTAGALIGLTADGWWSRNYDDLGGFGAGVFAGGFLDGVALFTKESARDPQAKMFTRTGRSAVFKETTGAMFSVAESVSSTLIPLATSHFLPIGAIAGGLTGLGIGVHDAIKNAQIRQLVKANDLLKSMPAFNQNVAEACPLPYRKLKRLLKKNPNLATAVTVEEENDDLERDVEEMASVVRAMNADGTWDADPNAILAIKPL